ncbi:MAG: hypothetical protein ACREN5_15970 [Gemmatimonadales bacterium]
MILANVRSRLRPADLRLVVVALSRGSATRRARYECLLATEGPDALLDQPGLLDALIAIRSFVVPSPELFLWVAVRHGLLAARIDDLPLSDYLAALVLGFGERDHAYRIADDDDQTYRYLTDLVSELEGQPRGERAFQLQVHLGEFSLWLAGLFPDYVEARRVRRGGPDLPYYDALGRQGYRLAADHTVAKRHGLTPIFEAAADRFPAVRNAFNRMSDRFFFPNVFSEARVLRSV